MIFLRKIKLLDPQKSYVLMDFDRTITSESSTSTWGLFEESEFVDPNYASASLELYKRYRPIELNHQMSFDEKSKHMEDWHRQVGGLLNKYHIYDETIEKILSNSHGMKLRKGADNFLEQMHMLGVPVIIVSAGLGEFIVRYLQRERLLFDNITVHANFFVFEDGKIMGIKQPIIHPLNKFQLDYSDIIGNRETGLLFGDQVEDCEMGRGLETLDIGFCNPEIHNLEAYKSKFDIVLTGESSYDEIGRVLVKGYKG